MTLKELDIDLPRSHANCHAFAAAFKARCAGRVFDPIRGYTGTLYTTPSIDTGTLGLRLRMYRRSCLSALVVAGTLARIVQ